MFARVCYYIDWIELTFYIQYRFLYFYINAISAFYGFELQTATK